MPERTGCLVCGSPLVYAQDARERTCEYCHEPRVSDAACEHGHFVCDTCHSAGANDLIQRVCSASTSTAPLDLAIRIMRDPRIKTHGPEHHYLVPAVLLAAYANASGLPAERRAEMVARARPRAEQVPGGSCGFSGACGAGIGTGIFVSVALGATPVSRSEWRQANLLTSRSLGEIAMRGGPRCCKRDTFIAIERAATFSRADLGVAMAAEETPGCEFHDMNRECLGTDCPYFPAG